MKLVGKRIHIAGSASKNCNEDLLRYIHSIVRDLTLSFARHGAGFIVNFGREPLLEGHDEGPSIIFDWTIAEAIVDALKEDPSLSRNFNGKIVYTVQTDKTQESIPAERRHIFDFLVGNEAIQSRFVTSGWNSGAHRRQLYSLAGDIFIGISGGEGVEHLASEYAAKGKPVIPFEIALGSSMNDGSGGAARLFLKAREDIGNFFKVQAGFSGTDLVDGLNTLKGQKNKDAVVQSTFKLLDALAAPAAFYVRLLNSEIPEYAQVDDFFRKSVDILVEEYGYTPLQMGIGENEFVWMNEAIFESLHYSGLVVIDLTTCRPNCFEELGYALGLGKKVIVTAMKGTSLPFDVSALEVYFWPADASPEQWTSDLRRHWERNINIPRLVKERKLL